MGKSQKETDQENSAGPSQGPVLKVVPCALLFCCVGGVCGVLDNNMAMRVILSRRRECGVLQFSSAEAVHPACGTAAFTGLQGKCRYIKPGLTSEKQRNDNYWELFPGTLMVSPFVTWVGQTD